MIGAWSASKSSALTNREVIWRRLSAGTLGEIAVIMINWIAVEEEKHELSPVLCNNVVRRVASHLDQWLIWSSDLTRTFVWMISSPEMTEFLE